MGAKSAFCFLSFVFLLFLFVTFPKEAFAQTVDVKLGIRTPILYDGTIIGYSDTTPADSLTAPDQSVIKISWTTSLVSTFCSASGSWSGSKPSYEFFDSTTEQTVHTYEITSPLSGPADLTYTLTCSYDRDYTTFSISDSATLSISAPPPLTTSCSVSPTATTTEQPVTWNTSNVSGGNGTYTYSWSGTDSLSGTGSSVSKSYGTQGTKTASVTVTSGSQTVTQACSNSLTVQNPDCTTNIDCSSSTCSASPNTCGPGSQTCKFTAPTPCNQVSTTQSCDVNCSSGFSCVTGQCMALPTVDLWVDHTSGGTNQGKDIWGGTASVTFGEIVPLYWTSQNASRCYTTGVNLIAGEWTASSKVVQGGPEEVGGWYTDPNKLYTYSIGCENSAGAVSDFIYVRLRASNCTSSPTCSACSASPNTCGPGSQTCTLTTGPTSPCTQVTNQQSCTVNCSSGYTCSSGGQCIINAPSSYSLEVRPGGTGSGFVSSSPSGINNCGVGSSCTAAFNTGTSVSLTATPGSGSSFAGWSGACSGTGSCTVTMDASKTLSATFSQNPNCSTSSTPWTSVACVLRSDITTTNTCSGNGRQTRTLDGPAPCIQTTQTQDCNVPNCSSGYTCSTSGSCVLPAQSCPTTCHTDTQYVPDGNGNQITCSPNNTTDYPRENPPACTTSAVTLRDGQCSTYNYLANCSGVCQGDQCTIAPTVNLLVNGVDGVGGLDNNSTANLSWITGNSPTSCTLYLLTGSGWVSLGDQSLATPNVTTGALSGPATYYFGMYCFNGAGTSNFDFVPVGINAPPNTSCSVSPTFTYTGQNVTWSASASGGTGSYTYSWSGTDGLSGTSSSVSKSYSGEGPKTGSVTVTSGPSTTVNCSNSVQACYPPQSCPTTCHTDIQSVPNGSCGQTTCSSNNTSLDYSRQEPPACSTSGGTLRDGLCSTYNYLANCSGVCQGDQCILPPTVDLTTSAVTIDNGTSATLSWTTTNSPTSCTAEGSWSGPREPSGSGSNPYTTDLLYGPWTYTYSITCSNSAGTSVPDSVTVTVNGPPVISILDQVNLLLRYLKGGL